MTTNPGSERRTSLSSPWMAPVLLLTAIPGVAFILLSGVLTLADGNSSFSAFGLGANSRLLDRAAYWVGVSVGGPAAWVSFTALVAFTGMVVLRRHDEAPVSDALRHTGFYLALSFALLELVGLGAIVGGLVQMSQDPTAPGDLIAPSAFFAPMGGACGALCVLAGLIAVLLWRAQPEPTSAVEEEIEDDPALMAALEVEQIETPATYPQEIFRRPVG